MYKKNTVTYKLKTIVTLVLCLSLMICNTGCEQTDEEKGLNVTGNYIYYVNKDNTNIVSREYNFKNSDTDKKITELLEGLRHNTDDVSVVKAIPDSVKILDYKLDGGIFSINFSSSYNKLPKSQEVLTRAAVVLTMIQLEDINYVSFKVDGERLKYSDGEVVENMNASSFANNLDSDKNVVNSDDFTIYFANTEGDKLVKYEFNAEYGSTISKEQFILNTLIEGPGEKEGLTRTLPVNAQVESVNTMDNVCYVRFYENFLTEQAPVGAELVIYSIVNSLSELSYIHKVQISISGMPDAEYQKISLSEPFVRNLDYVAEEE